MCIPPRIPVRLGWCVARMAPDLIEFDKSEYLGQRKKGQRFGKWAFGSPSRFQRRTGTHSSASCSSVFMRPRPPAALRPNTRHVELA